MTRPDSPPVARGPAPLDARQAAARAAAARAAAIRAAAAHRAAQGATVAAQPQPQPPTVAARPQPQPPMVAAVPMAPPVPKAVPTPPPAPQPPRKSNADKQLADARAVVPAVMKQLRALAESGKRQDLIETLTQIRRRSADSSVRVAVVGLRRKGKSQLINSLLNAEVCVVGERRSTSVVTTVRPAETPGARLLVEVPGGEPQPIPLPLEQLQSDLSKPRGAEGRPVVAAEIGIKNSILAGNLALTDTPGLGGRGQPHAVRVLNEVAISDAVIFVTDASQEFTAPELQLIQRVVGLCDVVAVALTKTDLYPEWRRIMEADLRHMDRGAIDCRILPVSAVLRSHAIRLGDKQLNAESGYPELLRYLRESVLADAASKRIVRIAKEFETVAQHLSVPLEAELNALRDPKFREKMSAELKEKKQLSDARAKTASTWQQVLSDGIADLNTEIDHDLKTRMRLIGKEAEAKLADGNPEKIWPGVSEWLQEQVGTAVADNFVWAFDSAKVLAERVAISFAEDGEGLDLPTLDAVCRGELIDPELTVGELSEAKTSRVQRFLVAIRGGYGGVGMAQWGTTLVGAAAAGPIGIGLPLVAGLLLGGQSYKDDRNNRATRRRGEAQSTARKYIDEVSFHVGKLSRDRLRTVQRTLRDHFKSIADQELASLQSSLKAAQESANLECAERDKKAAQAEQKLAILKKCRDTAIRLQAAGAAIG
jgi:GTPase Era involved in 16S rRNA processing